MGRALFVADGWMMSCRARSKEMAGCVMPRPMKNGDKKKNTRREVAGEKKGKGKKKRKKRKKSVQDGINREVGTLI